MLSLHLRLHKISIFFVTDNVYFLHVFKVVGNTFLYCDTFFSFEINKCFVKSFFETM